MAAPTRTARRAVITRLLGEHAARSQAELLDLLAREGITVTQATLSRDLLELGAERVRLGRDLVYAIPGEGVDRSSRAAVPTAELHDRLRKVADELAVTATASANLVVVRTPPGAANYLASAIDHARLPDILGTIAGDDTIMVITTDPSVSSAVAALLVPDASTTTSAAARPQEDS